VATPQNLIGQKDTARYESDAYTRQMAEWQIVDDCLAGHSRINAAGTRYLPKNPKEGLLSYKNRLARACYWNAYGRCIDGLTGMVYTSKPELAKDVPLPIVDELENVDLAGTAFSVFAKEAFRYALNDGHAFILVDMPVSLTLSNPNATKQDELIAGIRPYWKLVRKNQVISWRDTIWGGARILTQVVIRESLTTPDGDFAEKAITQYRVLRQGSWQIWRETDGGGLVLFNEGPTTLPVIPLAILKGKMTDFMVSTPTLVDLAHENLRHYRMRSDLDHILHFTQCPILLETLPPNATATGTNPLQNIAVPEAEPIEREISANSVFTVRNGGKVEWVTHDGKSITNAQEELKTSLGTMASLGLSVLVGPSKVEQTATQSVLDNQATASTLSGIVSAAEDGFEQALDFHAMYKGLPDGGQVKLSRNFERLQLDWRAINALSTMVTNGDLSHDTMYSELSRAGMLPADFVTSDELLRIVQERIVLGPKPAGNGTNPAAGQGGLSSGQIPPDLRTDPTNQGDVLPS
jgi:hypothetical protein